MVCLRFREGGGWILKAPLCRCNSLQPDQALYVVDEVGAPDLDSRPSDSDGPDEEAHSVLLLGEDVLDARTHGGLAAVGAADRRGHRAADGLLAMGWRVPLR